MAEENEDRPRIIGAKVLRGGAASSATIAPVAKREPEPAAPAAPAAPARRAVVSGEDYEAKQSANKIVEDARRQAQEIIDKANVEREEIFNKAKEEAKAEIAPQLAEELLRAKMQAGELMKGMESQIVELALKISAKIIGRDLERDPMVVAEIAATAIETARASKAMVLRVNPKDGVTLRKAKPQLMELIGRTVEVSIRDDAEIEAGGCVIQTEFGTIDGQIKTQYQMLENVLRPDTAKKEGPK